MLAALTIWRDILVKRLEGADDVDDLEARLAAAEDRLLAGDHHHRHGAEKGVGGARGEVQRARAERGDADAGLAGQPAVGRRHEGRRLLVPGQDQLDGGVAQALDDVEVFFARNAEDALNAFVLQSARQAGQNLWSFLPLPTVSRLSIQSGKSGAQIRPSCFTIPVPSS